MTVITVVGAGRMGTALCVPLVDRGHDVRLVGSPLDTAWIDALRASSVHPGLGVALPAGIAYERVDAVTGSLQDADIVVVGVSSAGIVWAGQSVIRRVPPGVPLVVVTKGLEWDGRSLVPMARAVAAHAPDAPCVAITGPCLAGELARRVPTVVVVSGGTPEIRELWIDRAATDYYRIVDGGNDVGHQVAAALKNAYAVALGLVTPASAAFEGTGPASRDGTGSVFNAQSAVFAQAVSEMAKLVGLAAGDPAAAHGLSGVGDLLVTMQGRNFEFGTRLAAGAPANVVQADMAGTTLEGPETLVGLGRAIHALERRGMIGVADLPLLRYLVRVMNEEPLPRLRLERLIKSP